MDYTIKNEYLTATFRSLGAELISLKSNAGIEYIWQRDPKYWGRCAPVLFPIVGNLRDKKTIINGQFYNMSQHGFLRDQEFDVLLQKDGEISFVNTFTNETLKMYPFKYKSIITYTLKDKVLRTHYTIINENNEEMPFNIGGHPAFNCPIYPGESFSDYAVYFAKPETFVSPKVEANGTLNFDVPGRTYDNLKKLPLDYSLFDIDTIVIPRVKSKTVRLFNKENKGIIFSFLKFISFAMWTPYGKDAPFICLEPWIGYADRSDSDYLFVKKDNIITLKSLGEFTAYYDIEIAE
jgi:galactose mutarotase-like enzyme